MGRWFVLAEEIWLISYSYLCKSTLCVVRHKVMTWHRIDLKKRYPRDIRPLKLNLLLSEDQAIGSDNKACTGRICIKVVKNK